MSINYSFSGKSVLITGGASGIGRTLVQKFYDGGAHVFTLDKNPEKIEELKNELPKIRAEVVDLADWEQTRKIVEGFGQIDHLVNNAGIAIYEKFMDVTKKATNLQLDINLQAVINVTQVFTKSLINTGKDGSVVNICSICGRTGGFGASSLYSATKAALENLTKSMAVELGVHGIRVNCILPGMVDTPIIKAVHGDGADEFFQKNVAPRLVNKRLIEPSEIGDSVLFLLSPLSSMIVGQGIVVDGGYLVT